MYELKNYQEIREYVMNLEEQIYEIEIELHSLGKKPKNSRKIKKKLQEIKQKRDKYVAQIDSLTTFEKESLLNFFIEYLPPLEGEEIEWKHIAKDYQEIPECFIFLLTLIKCLKYFLLDGKEEADIISDASSIETVGQLFRNYNIYSAFQKAEVKKGFYLDEEEIHLADGVGLNRKYISFPSIEYAFERLVDLGLENEKMTPQERLNCVLEEVKINSEEIRKRIINLKK